MIAQVQGEMMRWLAGLLWRSLLFWGLWVVGTVGVLTLLDGVDLSGEGVGRVGRITLFVSASVLILVERRRLERAILALSDTLRKAGREAPRRWETSTRGCLVIGFALGFWALALGVFSTALHGIDQGGALLWLWGLGTIAWTAVSLTLVGLLLGGLTRLRLRAAARGLSYPEPPVTLPWLVAAWCVPALVVAFFGLPDPRLVAAMSAMARAAAAPQDERGAVELLVELGPDDQIAEIAPALEAAGATAARAVPGATADEDRGLASTWVVTAPASQVALLALLLELDDENVSLIELNAAVSADPLEAAGPCDQAYASLPVNDPYAVAQRELVELNAGAVLGALSRRPYVTPVIVAVIDTGVMGGHEDLFAIMTPRPVNDDRRGHGTGVASLIAAVADNGRGIASLNLNGRYLQVLSLPVLDRTDAGADDVADAVEDALDADADVINLSFGARGPAPRVVQAAIQRALRKGVPVIAAAGNRLGGASTGHAVDQWPANVPGVLVVGSTGAGGIGRAPFSNLTDGVGLAVSAPGSDVCVAALDGGYTRTSGTSMSAATVSGVVALMRATCPTLRPDELAQLLIQSGEPQPGGEVGPRVDATKALGAALGRCPQAASRITTRRAYMSWRSAGGGDVGADWPVGWPPSDAVVPAWEGEARRVDTGD